MSQKNFDENFFHQDVEQNIFYQAVKTTFTGVAITDARLPDNPIVYLNPAFCKITGYGREEILGRNCRFLQGAETDRETVWRLREAIERGEAIETRLLNYRKDGQPFWNELYISPIYNSGGQLTHFVGIQLDVTEKVKTFQTVQKVTQEWTATVDSITDLILLTNAEGKLLRCNRATADFFDTDFSQLLGNSITELFESATVGEKNKQQALFQVPQSEFYFGANGCWLEAINYRVMSDEPAAEWVHVVKNITSQKEAAARLEWLDKAFQQAFDSIVITNVDGIIEQVNTAFVRQTGWNTADVVGLNLFDLQFEPSQKNFLQEIKGELLKGRTWSGSHLSRRRSGETYHEETTISPIEDEKGNVIKLVHIQRDVTEEKRLKSIAEAVNMTENIGYIFSGIRHELGNPINSVKTALSVLLKNIKQFSLEQIIRYVERSLFEIERVEYLLRTLRTFSLYEDLDLHPTNLFEVLQGIIALIENDFTDKGIKIFLDVKDDCQNIQAKVDQRAFYQVLLNILSNAADALEEQSIPFIKIQLQRKRHIAEILISDNGCGMNEEQLANLFKPFYTSKTGGNGLGLVICKKMSAKMNVTIAVTSEKGRGTNVLISLDSTA
jgi:PAS domain S-box-containing protein